MELWQLTRELDLVGEKGLENSARWHTAGSRVLYFAESPGGALLEARVHLIAHAKRLPRNYELVRVDLPETLAIETVDVDALPRAWWTRQSVTRAIGDAWLAARPSALLRVPSAIVEETWNLVVNVEHPALPPLEAAAVTRHRFDARLFRVLSRPGPARND